MILAFAVLGLVGALTTDIRWMQLYLLMLTVLFIWELIFILVSAIGHATPHSSISRLHLLLPLFPSTHRALPMSCAVL